MRVLAPLAAALLLAGAAQTQAQAQEGAGQGPIYAPCLAVHPQPTDTVAAFEAEGWTFHEEGAARDATLPGLSFSRLLATMLPPEPETLAELAELTTHAAQERQTRRYDASLIFTRGDQAASVEFDQMRDGRILACTFVAPHLPDLDGLEMRSYDLGDRPLGVEFAVPEVPTPEGADQVTVNAWRLVTDLQPPQPLPGAEAVSVSVQRTVPRFVVPEVHGLLRAFDTPTEAYRLPEEDSE